MVNQIHLVYNHILQDYTFGTDVGQVSHNIFSFRYVKQRVRVFKNNRKERLLFWFFIKKKRKKKKTQQNDKETKNNHEMSAVTKRTYPL
jgi:hypothetical protein